MSRNMDRKQRRDKVKRRSRHQVRGTSARPRLAVYRSLRHLYAQVIDDENGVTIASVSTLEKASAGDLASTGGREAASAWASSSPSGPRVMESTPWSSTAAVSSTTE